MDYIADSYTYASSRKVVYAFARSPNLRKMKPLKHEKKPSGCGHVMFQLFKLQAY